MPLALWPHVCPCCGARARTAMMVLPHDLSPGAQHAWHWLHLTRELSQEQQARLRETLATSDQAERAFVAAFQTPTLDPRQRRRAREAWLKLTREAVRGWRALHLDDDVAAVHIDEELAR